MCYYDQLNSIHLVSLSIFCRWLRFYELGCCLFRMLRLFYHYLFEIYFTMSFLYNFLSKEFFFCWVLMLYMAAFVEFRNWKGFSIKKRRSTQSHTIYGLYNKNRAAKSLDFFHIFFHFNCLLHFNVCRRHRFLLFSLVRCWYLYIYIYMFVIDIHI